jgi:hypothetical protein
MEQDLASCEDELFFMMKAITTSQQHPEDRGEQDSAGGFMQLHIAAKEIAWHLIRDKGESLMEVQIKDATFDRTENYDGSNYNSMEIGRINGYNLLTDALYPEIISPFTDEGKGGRHLSSAKMLRVHWLMLEAIAGIPVVDYFEIDLVPLKLQLEREVAKKLFEYIFPGVGGNAFDGGGFSPFMVKNMVPTQDEDENASDVTDARSVVTADTPDPDLEVFTGNGNGAGSLEHRMKPTLDLNKGKRPKTDPKSSSMINGSHAFHGFSLFQHSDKSRTSVTSGRPAPKQTQSRANLAPMVRSSSQRSVNTMKSSARTSSDGGDDRHKRALLAAHRAHNDDKKKKGKEKAEKDKDKPSDDLTQMMNRASNYMTLAYVKIPSMVLCLSYKGQGKRNIEDVHDFVFTMPTLEYRNKTWSNLDLALQLKKDFIRALISHAGAIVGNKFSHYKPNRQQQSRLRELVSKSTFMSPTPSQTAIVNGPSDWTTRTTGSDTSSFADSSPGPPTSGRPSTNRPASSRLAQSINYSSASDSASDVHRMSDDLPTNGYHEQEDSQSTSQIAQKQNSRLTPGSPGRDDGSEVSEPFSCWATTS